MTSWFLAGWLSVAAAAEAPAWWASLGDPQLAALIEGQLGENHDVQAAWARVQGAEAGAWAQGSSLLPTVSFDLSGSASPYASLGFQFGGLRPPTDDDPFAFYNGSAMFNAGWNIDLFGRQLSQTQAAKRDAAAAAGDLDAMAAGVAVRIATGWFDLVTAVEQRRLAERQLGEAQKLLDVLNVRYGGDATALDLLQQRQQVASLRASVPRAKAAEQAARAQLGALLGGVAAVPAPAAALPKPAPAPDEGALALALGDRADVRAAEARVEAAEARRRAAMATAAPSLQVRGNAGWQATKITESRSQSVWGANAGVSVPILAGGRNYQQVKSAGAAVDAAGHALEQARLNAAASAASAHAQLAGLDEQRLASEAQREAASFAYEVATEQYLRGTTSFLVVQSTHNALIASELGLLAVHRQQLGAQVQLHDALGGAWTRDLAGLQVNP